MKFHFHTHTRVYIYITFRLSTVMNTCIFRNSYPKIFVYLHYIYEWIFPMVFWVFHHMFFFFYHFSFKNSHMGCCSPYCLFSSHPLWCLETKFLVSPILSMLLMLQISINLNKTEYIIIESIYQLWAVVSNNSNNISVIQFSYKIIIFLMINNFNILIDYTIHMWGIIIIYETKFNAKVTFLPIK